MKILLIADFRRDSPHFLLNNPRMFSKGFVRNGHDVLEFSYRDILLGLSPVRSKKWAARLAKDKTDRLLRELASHHQPDLIFIAAFKLLNAETIRQLKELLPRAVVMCWYSDMYDGINPMVAPIARECDWFLSTGGGAFLQGYKALGIPHCAFLPNPCDPDVQYPREVAAEWRSKIIFTGKLKHGQSGQDPLRRELLEFLVKHRGLTVWGGSGAKGVTGLDYIRAICGAEIALSINAFNNVRFYHSDRLIHYLSCGAFVLAKNVPDGEMLFADGRHLCYFDSLEECVELIDRFGADADGRRRIAAEGVARAHDAFNCRKLAGHVIDLLTRGAYDEPFCDVVS